MTQTDDPIELPRTSPWPIIGWLLLAVAIVVLVISVLAGLLLPAVILDVVSFWPAWVVALLVALALWPLRRRGIARLGAVLPLLVFTWIGVAVGLHLQEWSQLPSSAGDLRGPSALGVTSAALTLELDGRLEVRGTGGPLYTVRLFRGGGDVGPAEALERIAAASATLDIRERQDAGWFASDGWRLGLARSAAWDLTLTSSAFDVDLIGLDIRTLDLVGDGDVRIPTPSVQTEISLTGDIAATVPVGARVEVFGSANVPPTWTAADNGFTSGGSGAAILITVVEGASVDISEG